MSKKTHSSKAIASDQLTFEATRYCVPDLNSEVWKVESPGHYNEWVLEKDVVTSYGPLGAIGRNGWYIQDYALDLFPSIAGFDASRYPLHNSNQLSGQCFRYRGLLDSEVSELCGNELHAVSAEWGPDDQVSKFSHSAFA